MTSELFDESSHMANQIQGFEPNNNEEFNFSTGMGMIGFGKKNLQQQQSDGWKGLCEKSTSSQQLPGPSSSSRNIMSTAWHESEFIDETNPSRPSQGLSLSLYSSLGLQGQVNHHSQDHQHDDVRFVTFNNGAAGFTYDQHVDGFSWKSTSFHQGEFQLRNSQYLGPAQDLLNEFCSPGTTKQNDILGKQKDNKKSLKQWEDQEQDTISSTLRKQSLHSLDSMELHRRKLKLLSMLEKVDRRYKHYLDQMKSVVSAFEDVAGRRSADLYTTLALKAMSKHFRCLRDAILNQIQETKKVLEDKNKVVAGTSRGETPRLKALDQSFRRQMALQQTGMMESHPWRPQRGLPERSVSILRAWLFEHFLHPYPTDVDKHILSRQTGLSKSQVSNWFINARVRVWKPMVEEMYVQESKERENTSLETDRAPEDINGHSSHENHHEDQKPNHEQLAIMDSACLHSNIITSQQRPDDENNQNNNMQHQDYGRLGEDFGALDLDFYNNQGVSLTLGLQQHEGSLAFSPTAPENSLFYSRDPMEDCQPVQYSLIDRETHNLPYRDLMGAQLLHDLAGSIENKRVLDQFTS